MLSRHTCLMRTPNITSIRQDDSSLVAPWETPDLRAGKLSWIVTVGWAGTVEAASVAKIRPRWTARLLIWRAMWQRTWSLLDWLIAARFSLHTRLAWLSRDRKSTRLTPVTWPSRMPSSA